MESAAVKRVVAEEFRCPACSGELSGTTNLVCARCARTFPLAEGILDFRVHDRDYYFNPVPPEEMRALIRDMERDGWTQTVGRFLRHVRRPVDWIDNIATDGRYAWKLLLDLRPDGVLLDIGCGLGNLSFNLAPHVGKVYAMDLTYERAAFSCKRFKIAGGRDHVVVLGGGDGEYLPFPAASLDYVVLSGVLEWVGEAGVSDLDEGSKLARAWRMVRSSFGPSSPRAVQLRFLREIRRVLRPAGQLFVAIENRTGYRYFLGDPDNHSELRYGTLLPRFLANLYSIWAARRPYRTYTYSIPGHRRLLREAGFPAVQFFGLFPGYSQMTEIVPLAAQGDRWRPKASTRIRARLARSKYLVPAYGIVASDRENGPRLLDEVVAAVETALQSRLGSGRIQLGDYRVTGKDKGLLTAVYAGSPIVIKLPFGSAAKVGELANARFLQFAKNAVGRGLDFIPASHCSGVVRNVDYFAEDRCKGVPLHEAMVGLERSVLLAQLETVLAALNSDRGNAGESVDAEFYRVRVSEPLGRLSAFLDPGLRSELEAFFLRGFDGVKLPRGIEHGDFGCSNILVEGGRVTGLVDWEAARIDGIPLLDVLSCVEGIRRHSERTHLGSTIPLLARGEWSRAEWAFVERQYQRLGVDAAHHEALVYLYWLHHVSSQVAYGLAYYESRIERDVIGVARQLLEGK